MGKVEEKVTETPLPRWQIVSVCMIQMSEACNILFPFMAFMVEDMGYSGHRLGYYVGGLAGAFCAAQFCSSVLWGMISDTYGRKFAIISGTLGAALGMLVFGSAKVYVQAVIGRLIGGFLCGNLGVMKSFLAEITDDTNRGRGFSYISSFWSVGCLIAPLIGGLLSNPADKYPNYFSPDGLFGYFPYLLPCLLCASLNVCTVILCAITMTETRKFKSAASQEAERADGLELTSVQNPLSRGNDKPDEETGHSSGKEERKLKKQRNVFIIKDEDDDTTDEEESLNEGGKISPLGEREGEFHAMERTSSGVSSNGRTDVDSDTSDSDEKGSGKVTRRRKDIVIDDSDEICCANFSCYNIFAFCSRGNKSADYDAVDTSSKHGESDESETPATKSQPGSSLSVLRRRGVILATSSYGILCMGYILFDETIPLFLKLDRKEGGFSFDSGRIGTLISISAGVMLMFTTFVLPHFANRSKKWLYEIGIICAIPLALGWPGLAVLNSTVLLKIKDESTYLLILWPLLVLLNISKNVCSCLSFTAVMIQVNHSTEEEHLGAVNGLGQSLAAFARAIGPVLGGMLWSISVQVHFIFLNFLGVISILFVCGYVNRLLPPSIDFKKRKPTDASSSHEEEALDAVEMMH